MVRIVSAAKWQPCFSNMCALLAQESRIPEMLHLERIAKIIIRSYRHPVYRHFTAKANFENSPSAREKAWHSAQQKYSNYKNILYSSHVEANSETDGRRARRNDRLGKQLQKRENEEARKRALMALLEEDEPAVGTFPKGWMEDYEFYEGATDEMGTIDSTHGTADPSVPPSTVPCNGCGAHLHCASASLPGFIPKEIFYKRSTEQLKTIVCQRCHFLQHYNIALDVEIAPETYVDTISAIKDKFALAVVIVDLLDFPCSIWPGMQELLGPKRPVFVVGNKVDLLPRDSNGYLERVKACLQEQVLRAGFNALNVKYISLISAKTGYGIEELITQLHKIWKYNGDVYLLGCTNVGKSSLFNILLNSDYCRPTATDLVRKATACPWPGTTLKMLRFPILRPSDIRIYQRTQRLISERGIRAAEQKLRQDQARKTGSIKAAKLIGNVGQTFTKHDDVNDAFSMAIGTQPIEVFNERSKDYKEARWCYDTPGVMHPDQLTQLLTTSELLKLEPNEMIRPRAVRLQPGLSLLLAGLGRLDFIEYKQPAGDWTRIFVFASPHLPLVITPTAHAHEVYDEYLGTELLGMPCGDEDRLARWPGLQCNSEELVINGSEGDQLNCDIVFSSAGWVGLKVPSQSQCRFKAWTPYARGIYMRDPPLITYADRLVGKRIRNSLAYHLSKPFVFVK